MTQQLKEPALIQPELSVRRWWITNGIRIALVGVIALALVEAWWITPDRDYYKPMDFAMYYTAGRMFVHGANPYDRARAEDTWDSAGGDYDVMDMVLGPNTYDTDHPGSHWLPINLIPPALAVLAPFGLLVSRQAWPVWNTVVVLLLIGQTFAGIRLMNKPIWHPASLCFIALCILLEPLHIGLANGQPAVPAVSLIVISIWLSRINWQICAGIALAIATALKPQLAAPFAVYFLWQKNYKTLSTAVVMGIVLTLLAIVPMQLHGIHWLHDWIGEVKYAELTGGINDARVGNAGRHDMIHLQVLLHLISDNAMLINGLAVFMVLCLGGLIFIQARNDRSSLTSIAAFSILALLPIYHRLYDAGILVLPIAWAICNSTGRGRWFARIALLVIAAFFIDQEWLNAWFVRSGSNPKFQSSWWFNTLAEPHHAWQLLAIFFCVYLSAKFSIRPLPTN